MHVLAGAGYAGVLWDYVDGMRLDWPVPTMPGVTACVACINSVHLLTAAQGWTGSVQAALYTASHASHESGFGAVGPRAVPATPAPAANRAERGTQADPIHRCRHARWTAS